MKRTISIVIPTYNRRPLLMRTLESVGAVFCPDGVGVDVTVVANACTDDTVVVVEALSEGYSVPLRCVIEATPGLNNARNAGVRATAGEYLLLLDDDVSVDSGLVARMLEAYDYFNADLVGASVELWWEAVERPDWLEGDLEWILSGTNCGDATVRSLDGIGLIGAGFSFRRAVYDRIGGFLPGLDRVGGRLLGGGESEFIQRALRSGFQAVHAPKMRVKHWVAPHRILPEYILGVSAGYGEARIYLKPAYSGLAASRAFIGHCYLAAWHSMLAALSQRPVNRMRHRIRASIGIGGLRGMWRRWVGGKSPAVM